MTATFISSPRYSFLSFKLLPDAVRVKLAFVMRWCFGASARLPAEALGGRGMITGNCHAGNTAFCLLHQSVGSALSCLELPANA